MRTQLLNVGTGQPVKPDFEPRMPKDLVGNTVQRGFVKTTKEMERINLQNSSPTPPELGSEATRITRQVAQGKIDTFA